jgi:hypothetical protein
MRQHSFGPPGQISPLTVGGGLGQLWGPTTFDECVATVGAAADAGRPAGMDRRGGGPPHLTPARQAASRRISITSAVPWIGRGLVWM